MTVRLRRLPAYRKSYTPIIMNYLVAGIYAFIVIIPIYFVFISGFKTNAEIFANPLALPSRFSFDNFITVQERIGILRAIGMSFMITTATEVSILAVGFPAAYAIARIRTPLASIVESYLGIGFLIPSFSVLVSVFLLSIRLDVHRDIWFLIAYYTAAKLPITVILLASYLRAIPVELEESAGLDGASRFQMMLHIFFPLAKPGIITVLVLNFIDIWNEYIFALILLSNNDKTVQVAIPLLRSQFNVDYSLIAAGVVISIIPVYIVFIFFQERIAEGMLSGAVKS